MLKLSKKEDYAFILLNILEQNYKKETVSLSSISKKYKIPLLFLRNIAGELRKKGIIKAHEGKTGGYFLDRDPKKIIVGDILNVFSQKQILDCIKLKKIKKCPSEDFCKPKIIWRKLNQEFIDKIYNLSLDEFFKYK